MRLVHLQCDARSVRELNAEQDADARLEEEAADGAEPFELCLDGGRVRVTEQLDPQLREHPLEPIWNDLKYYEMNTRSFDDILALRTAATAALDRKASKLMAASRKSENELRAAA